MTRFADLHIHTHFSDSTSSPKEVIEQAHKKGLNCIAITDHDTVDGIKPTMEAAKKYEIEVLPGVELSSEANGKDIHVLGYLFDIDNTFLLNQLDIMQNTRIERMKKIIFKLDALGIKNIALEEVCALAQSKSVGRPHIATILVKRGVVRTIKDAFDKYLAEGAAAYVPKHKITPGEAIKMIKGAGGVAVLAHPHITQVDELIPSLVREGLDGLEVYYPNTFESSLKFYENLAKKYNVLATGGSDAHGEAKKNTYVGKIKIPYELVEQLKKRVQVSH